MVPGSFVWARGCLAGEVQIMRGFVGIGALQSQISLDNALRCLSALLLIFF